MKNYKRTPKVSKEKKSIENVKMQDASEIFIKNSSII